MALARMSGQISENMKGTGPRISCKVKVFTVGQTIVNMTELMKMIKRMVLAYFTGQMGENMLVNGEMVSSMDKQHSQLPMERLAKASGKMAKE